jgi:ubiquinone/menaquinone biosynthesis C-methylase UbiE
MVASRRTYLPAAGHDWFLPLYDPFVRLLGGDAARERLIDQGAIEPGHRILEIGCGTGGLVLAIKRRYPAATVVGLDPDPKALARADRKAERARLAIDLDQGFADALPYPEGSFERVFSSFMFHHLQGDEKPNTLREVRRVLAPHGSLHLVDFAGGEAGSGGFLARWLHASHRFQDNSEERLLALMRQAGLANGRKVSDGSMLFGSLRLGYYRASAG